MGGNGKRAASAEPQPDEVMVTLPLADAQATAHHALQRIGGPSNYSRVMLSHSWTDRMLDCQSKMLLLRFRELEPVIESRGHGSELPRLRAMALSTIRPVTRARWQAKSRAARRGAALAATMFPVLAGATVLGWSWWLGFDDRSAVGLIGLWLLTAVSIVLAEWCLGMLSLLSLISDRLAWSCAAAILAISVWLTARQVVAHHDMAVSWLEQFRLISASLPVLAALSIALPIALVIAEARRLADIDCLQALFVDLLDTAHLSAGLFDGRPAEPDSNPMAGRVYDREHLLRSLARTGASAVTGFPTLAANHPGLQSWADERGRAVSALMESHMKVILNDSPTSTEAVRDSLINGLVHLARRDWDALLVEDPGPAPPKSSRNWLLRLGLAGVLVAAAFAMPLLLGDAMSTDLESWRITLIVSAGFALISPDPQKARDALVSFRS